MITPLHYTVQAIADFKDIVEKAKNKGVEKEIREMAFPNTVDIVKLLENSPRFIMPEGGLYFEDKKIALKVDDDMLRLPYPSVVLEFHFPKEFHTLKTHTVYSTKRIVLLTEYVGIALNGTSISGIAIYPISFIDESGVWVISDGAVLIARTENHTTSFMNEYCLYTTPHEVPLCVFPIIDLAFIRRSRAAGSRFAAEQQIMQESFDEIIATTHFLSVIACNNVETRTPEREKPPVGKLGKKKKQYYDAIAKSVYKVLQLKPDKETIAAGQGGHSAHSKVRMHLRRGHIRRLPTGKRIWITSCIVGDAENGKVTKDYAIVK